MMVVLRKDDGTIIATQVELANSLPRQLLGLMFRKCIPENYAMIFDMRYEQPVNVHMLFVPFPIDLAFLDRSRTIVDTRARLRPWTGYAIARRPGRYMIEMPAGTLDRFRIIEGMVLQW